MADTVIAPHPPNDGREWDAQCARCGSSVIRERCASCGGDGFVEDDFEWHECDDCDGAGGWQRCVSDAAWCEAHPLKDRAQVERGAVEWFVIGGDNA